MQRYGDFRGFATILLTFKRICCDKEGGLRQIVIMKLKAVVKGHSGTHSGPSVSLIVLEAGSYHLLTQFMNMGEDFTFPLSRRLLEAIDIVTQ